MNHYRKLLVGVLFLFSSQAIAAFSPASVSILNPVQFPPEDFAITGARLSVIWGKHRKVYGFDLGAVGNVTEQSFGGIGLSGVFNLTRGQTTILGLQAAGVANVNSGQTRVFGLQAALGLNSNTAESLLVGLQIAALSNYSPYMKICGAQVGIYNRAREVYGFQIGLINVAESLHGIQLGLINYNLKGLFYVAPILNIGF